MRELVESVILLMANTLDADTVVLYLEEEEKLEPYSFFSLRKETKFFSVDLERDSLLKGILEKWPPIFVSGDEKILKILPYKAMEIPKVFMAVPFKIGKRRALLCADSFSAHNFHEKQQRIAVQFAEFIKSLFIQDGIYRKFFVDSTKFKLLSATLDLIFSEGSLNEKFATWCENLGVSVGVFFVKQGADIIPFLVYSHSNFSIPDEIVVGPRSLVFIAVERGEDFIFDVEENEPFEGVKSYGAVIPVELKKGRGCLFLGSHEKGFFSKELEDLLKNFAKIVGYMCFSETESSHPSIGNSVEFRNQLRIMCSRAIRDGKKLSIALIRFTNILKLREKMGFWESEERIEELITGFMHEFFPYQIFWARVTESSFFALKFNRDRDSDREFRKLFREEIMRRLSDEKVDVTFFLFPDEVNTYEDLCEKLERYVMQKPNRRLFG